MPTSYSYRTILQFQIFHSYFLNRGLSGFLEASDSEKVKRMATYDWRSYLKITPTPLTAARIRGHRLIEKRTPHSYTLVGKANDSNQSLIPIDQKETFQFYISSRDPDFLNYTALDISSQQFLFLSNHSLLDYIPDFQTIDTATIQENHLVSREVMLNNLLGLHSLPKTCIGVMSIAAQSSLDGYSLVADDGTLLPGILLPIWLPNRSTYWRYNFKSGTTLETDVPLPLTKNGFIELDNSHLSTLDDYETAFPNPSHAAITLEGDRSYSELFINF